jgi:hypothetical protein
MWHLPYPSIMEMPATRRYRLITEKIELEKKREAQAEADAARARNRR